MGRSRVCAGFLTIALILFLGVVTAPTNAAAQNLCQSGHVCVTTWQQDTGTNVGSGYSYRTGQNLSESSITYSSITSDNFGQKCSAVLDGQVYAQPLIVTDVNWKNFGTNYAIAYVVTQNDTVYAIDGTNCNVLGSASLLQNNPNQGATVMTAVDCSKVGGKSCSPVNPIIGVLGTPVISVSSDKTAGTLYIVAETQSVNSGVYTFYHFLHALDITTLSEGVGNENYGAPIQICSDANKCGSYPSASQFSSDHIQRPGLLYVPAGKNGLTYDTLYIGFSMMDGTTPPYFPNGVLVGYDATSLSDTSGRLYFQSSVGYNTTTSNGGGIWMSGAAPAFGPDANGSNWIFLTTANGTWDASSNWGDSFIKLNPATLTIPSNNGYFTPADQWYRSAWSSATQPACPAMKGEYPAGGDQDVGVGGVMLIPDSELTNWPYLAVNGEKEGGIWFYNRTTPMPSRTNACDPPHDLCNCPESTYPDHNVQTYWGAGGQFSVKVMRGGMAFWELERPSPGKSYIYGAPYGSALTQYPLCDSTQASGSIDTTTCSNEQIVSTSATFATGVTPAVSAASSTDTDAIVWAIWATGDSQSPLPTSPGLLYAFDADNVSSAPLYVSTTCPNRARIAPATKFSVPTVANGYVYVGGEQCTWKGSQCTNSGTGTFYIFTTLSNTIPCS